MPCDIAKTLLPVPDKQLKENLLHLETTQDLHACVHGIKMLSGIIFGITPFNCVEDDAAMRFIAPIIACE